MDQAMPANQSFFGASENAEMTQIWIAISVYVLVAIIKKRLDLRTDLYKKLQMLCFALFEKVSLDQLLANCNYNTKECVMGNQLNLFRNLTGQQSIGDDCLLHIIYVNE
jgi:hypothetical protein